MAMHDDQVHIDADIARQLIDDSFPQYRSEPIEHVDSQGTVNAIYRVGSVAAARFSLRAADPHALEAALQRESAGMIEFASACPFPTPRPIGLGRPGRAYRMPWAMQTWLEGDVATPTGLAASATFAADLAALIESLRAADTRGRTFNGQGRGGRIADQDEWMETSFRQSTELLDVAQLRSIWRRLRDLPPAGYDTMSHKDLIPANILVRGERIVGILDAGDFGPADPALDLVALWHLLDAEGRASVRSRLEPAPDEWLRGAAWAFVQAMGVVWYYEHTNPGMSALGRSTLQRLLDDPGIPGGSG